MIGSSSGDGPGTPTVSVVIPTYNQSTYLLEAIESVLGQSFKDYEIIVVDDGCTDDTLERLRPYADRLQIISQSNAGTGVARNRGIAEARGKYVALLDHDDWWLPEKLAVQVEFMEKHPECVAVAVPYANSRNPHLMEMNPALLVDAEGHVPRPLNVLARHAFMGTSSLMFRRKKAAGLAYGSNRHAIEDIQFQIGLISKGPVGIAGDKVLAVWRIHDSNFSRQSSYYYSGQKILREMERDGAFELDGEEREDLRHFLGSNGRISAVRQLVTGHRLWGWELYLREFWSQLRLGRLKFLLSFPVLSVLPPSWLHCLLDIGGRHKTEARQTASK